MSIRNITGSTQMPKDLAQKLKPRGVNALLVTIWHGYSDLILDKSICITCTSVEDDITLELYGKISQKWYRKNRSLTIKLNKISPVHQYPDETLKKQQGYKPTIDFCFRDWDTSNSYFGVECKNLYEKAPLKIKRYVDTGVTNYTSGRYGSESSENAIIGYILSGNLSEIISELIEEIKNTTPISNLTVETKYMHPQYYSRHKRILDNKDIVLHHLFFDFT